MVIPSSSLLPFAQYPWLISENTLEIFVISGLVLVLIGSYLYQSWRALEGSGDTSIKKSTPTNSEVPLNSVSELQKNLKDIPIIHKEQLNALTLHAIELTTGSKINPRVPARQQILPTSAKNILIDLERIMYDKITTESDLEEFRTRLLKYLN
jgi:hypothetical protein